MDVSDENFDDFIGFEGYSIIYCWAPWCKPCSRLNPIIESVAEFSRGEISVGKLDIDSSKKMSRKLGIKSIPAILIFNNGKQVNVLVGSNPSWTPESFKNIVLKC